MGDAQVPLLGENLKGEDWTESVKPDFVGINIIFRDQGDSKERDFSSDEVRVAVPISDHLVENGSLKDNDSGLGEESMDGDLKQMQKALDLFSDVPSFGKLSTIDPFVNRTPATKGLYESLKTLLLLPVLVARLLVIGVILVVGFVATKLALAGWDKSESVLPIWRRKLMFVTRLCGRGILFCFGFHWIRRIGRPARKEVAPIVVSNHVSFIDPIFYFYELFPSIVSSKSHDSLFLAGTIIRAMQVIPVDRTSAESRKSAINEIKRRAASMEFPSVLLFPEGTTTNGRSLISFKLGAFTPGFPIQPVVIRYPFVHFDISWGDISLPNVLFRMFTQFSNFMEVEYLPVVYPSAWEVENPALFAERRSPASYMVEMGLVEKTLGLRTGDAKSLLEKFAAMDPSYCGTIGMKQFLEWHHLPKCSISRKIFDLFDKSGQGFVTFREYLAASGSISTSKEFNSRMRAAYNACSSPGGGRISPVELENCLKLSMPSISNAKLKTWFKKLDLDGDGAISWEEFQVFIEANSELLPIFMVGTFVH
nr:lysophospholipid acyltransferase LPEAT2-like isoform X2 [Physcomitrium patens]|eukprot:XP_024380993.1 lysophospholipid acyltransferase LPEAT2-like isoform X2 [Physcomitrella patens]